MFFYHRGNFFSQGTTHPGMMAFHPSDFIHTPHPDTFKVGRNATCSETHKIAVMINTEEDLTASKVAKTVEDTDYENSWKGDQ